ncbi:MAG: YdcF family protein [Oscillospiraceae bacterium]|nr:YdcF family protein [Oscillospiraceae bacterium]
MNWKKLLLRTLCVVLCLCVGGLALVFGINAYVVYSTDQHILSVEEAAKLEDVDCILILGCGIRDDGTPSVMLRDRLRRGVELYQLGAAPKLLMTGDHGRVNYDEVYTMKAFAVDKGIPSGDVFMDHAGFSTYESMYRAKEIFQADKIIIVTQTYHLFRSIYIARSLGIEAYGVDADLVGYGNGNGREMREVLARVKDTFTCIFKPEPTYLGEQIPIWGDGSLTHDENSDFS